MVCVGYRRISDGSVIFPWKNNKQHSFHGEILTISWWTLHGPVGNSTENHRYSMFIISIIIVIIIIIIISILIIIISIIMYNM